MISTSQLALGLPLFLKKNKGIIYSVQFYSILSKLNVSVWKNRCTHSVLHSCDFIWTFTAGLVLFLQTGADCLKCELFPSKSFAQFALHEVNQATKMSDSALTPGVKSSDTVVSQHVVIEDSEAGTGCGIQM